MIPRSGTRTSRSAFSLLELLAVIAVIGILAALIFPSIGAARKSANRAKTKVQFAQWAAAIESFRSEYGYYPAFHASGLVNGGATTTLTGEHVFHDILAGRKRDGSDLTAGSTPATQNRKRIPFYSFGEGEFTDANAVYPHFLHDAFDNLSIAVLVDRNLDGRIDTSDYASYPVVALPDGTTARPSSGGSDTDIPATGLRAGVVLYCAAPNATSANPEFILSWK
jgi:prepilin-type N-terminal cleavage/methylation domain-containing protein